MNYEEEIIELKKKLDIAKQKRDTAMGRLTELENRKNNLIKEITAAGSTPETIDKDIRSLNEEIERLIAECKKLMPEGI